jgi:hypothetical protein
LVKLVRRVIMNCVNIILNMLEDLTNIMIRAVGNAALSVGFRAISQVLRGVEGSEINDVATKTAASAAAWYATALMKLDRLSPRERMYSTPQTMEGMIDFLLSVEEKTSVPTPELLRELGVSAEEYSAVAAAVREEQRTWLKDHRAEIESRWESLVANGISDDDLLGPAAVQVAGKILSRIDRIRQRRLKAFMRGWQDALGELALLKEYESQLFKAWEREGGDDDDLLN